MTALNADARQQLRAAGVTQAAWIREHFTDGQWHGDACGCTDDRCIGHHHDAREECGCLTPLISEFLMDKLPGDVLQHMLMVAALRRARQIREGGDQ